MLSKKHQPCTSAIIVAAGSSTRMGGINKQLLLLDGVPVLAHTLMQFEACRAVGEIIVVTSPDLILTISDMVHDFGITKVTDIIPGGKTRQSSVFEGLKRAGGYPLVAIHDGARPFATTRIIENTIEAAKLCQAAAPGVPVKDTVKKVSETGIILATPDRSTLRLIQTPQIFEKTLIKNAYALAEEKGFEGTDDCSLVEFYGAEIKVTEGEYTNIKITTPEDIPIAEAILASLKNGG